MVAFSIPPWLSEKTISNLKRKLAVGTGGRIRTRSTSWLPQFVRYILFKSILNSSITSCFSICPCENVLDHETFCVPCSSAQLLATRSRRILRQFWSNTSDYQSERRSVQKTVFPSPISFVRRVSSKRSKGNDYSRLLPLRDAFNMSDNVFVIIILSSYSEGV